MHGCVYAHLLEACIDTSCRWSRIPVNYMVERSHSEILACGFGDYGGKCREPLEITSLTSFQTRKPDIASNPPKFLTVAYSVILEERISRCSDMFRKDESRFQLYLPQSAKHISRSTCWPCTHAMRKETRQPRPSTSSRGVLREARECCFSIQGRP